MAYFGFKNTDRINLTTYFNSEIMYSIYSVLFFESKNAY